jgi:tetratricopeptide (TPR) repeat protein
VTTASRLAAILLLLGSPLAAQQPVPSANLATLEAARAAYAERGVPARATAAVELFTAAAREDPASYEARWEGARAAYFLGEYTRTGAPDKERIAVFEAGIALAKEAVALRPKAVEGHFWLGVLDGVWGEARGIFKSLAMVPLIKQEMAICLEADPAYEAWGADRVLGRLYFRLPFFKGGDNAKAIAHLEKSLQGEPANALTRLYLAEVYKAEGMKPKAIEQLRAVLAMTPDPRWIAEHPLIKARAEKLLAKLS